MAKAIDSKKSRIYHSDVFGRDWVKLNNFHRLDSHSWMAWLPRLRNPTYCVRPGYVSLFVCASLAQKVSSEGTFQIQGTERRLYPSKPRYLSNPRYRLKVGTPRSQGTPRMTGIFGLLSPPMAFSRRLLISTGHLTSNRGVSA